MEAESFDKKIRELLESAEFPYQEADWQQAQALLQKERKRRALGWLWLLPALAIGTAWWALAPEAAVERSQAQLPVSTSPTGTAKEDDAAASHAVATTIQETSQALAETAIAREPRQPQGADHLGPSAGSAKASMQNLAATTAEESPSSERPAAVNLLPTLRTMLSRIAIERPMLEKRAVAPLTIDRIAANTPPTLALGLWAATQPTAVNANERGIGTLNIQSGAFASLQFHNGLYGQWLSGLQHQDLNAWTYTHTAIRYDFGEEKTTKTLELRDYWTLQNTLLLGYAQNKHRWYAALTYQHYLFSRYQLHTRIERQDAAPQSATTSGRSVWPAAQVPRWVPALGYQFEISPAFRLGIQYQFSNRNSETLTLPTAAPWQFNLQYHLFQRQQP